MPSTAPERFRLDGKVAIITGAGKGIGAAIAKAFAEVGADCVLTARTEADLEQVASEVVAAGGRALPLAGDINDLVSLASIVDRTIEHFGAIDIVVNNAGGSLSRPFLDTSVSQLEKSFHFNVSAPFELVRLAVPHMLQRGSGTVCNIGSVAGRKGLLHGWLTLFTRDRVPQERCTHAEEVPTRVQA